jgi:hypothetical protein
MSGLATATMTLIATIGVQTIGLDKRTRRI